MAIPRRIARRYWKLFNPLAIPLAGWAPWWVVLETVGRRTGKPRLTPLANGPRDENTLYLIVVHGERAAFAMNLAANPTVRVKHLGKWRSGEATLVDPDHALVVRFSRYARTGLRLVGDDAKILRVQLTG